ncbi:unnamed protein product [Zymoseptoria tritici ST99CH_1A5]|uniref:Uncharacterized protein n=2 Tax=Zymoseptoria tritici TaxID=1047171 RepID=A0A2H1GFK9_ZYMTR|nr:unnamed protein product [Zymoseptoria tritici ST99CH_1E4]SMR53449.1 unnamed protein product [Zymoseptoria tritici ST99CH_3D1]SMY24239.1 unnamed protein product [Zymoseptoria tritici ST99CH_1A5]
MRVVVVLEKGSGGSRVVRDADEESAGDELLARTEMVLDGTVDRSTGLDEYWSGDAADDDRHVAVKLEGITDIDDPVTEAVETLLIPVRLDANCSDEEDRVAGVVTDGAVEEPALVVTLELLGPSPISVRVLVDAGPMTAEDIGLVLIGPMSDEAMIDDSMTEESVVGIAFVTVFSPDNDVVAALVEEEDEKYSGGGFSTGSAAMVPA